MGVWGSSLYANDTTCDVRDSYMGYLQEQLSNEEAFEKTLEDYEELVGDQDEEPLFWFALAETQWKVGRLTSDVKEKALEWIKKEGGIALWEDNGSSSAGWKRTLSKLKEKLESPMRSEKKIRKPEVIDQNLWNIGDVYAYQFHTEKSKEYGTCGKYVLLQKMGERKRDRPWLDAEEAEKQPLFMIINVFDKLFDDMPTLKDVESVKLLPRDPNIHGELIMNRMMELFKKKHYPEKHLTYLGNTRVSINQKIYPYVNPVFWDQIEDGINYCFTNYHDKEYAEVEEGVFKFTDSE